MHTFQMFDIFFHIVYVGYMTAAPKISSFKGDTLGNILYKNCDLQVRRKTCSKSVPVEQHSPLGFYLLQQKTRL